ncbi:MAG TPA: ACP phosphodiesterase [Xanthomonadaceae bacterium]|nr:ACP phosphodiesterase [Xanthomonadaceae bacterium]
MNTLAHLQLALPDDGWLAGAVLGDYWRGAPDPGWPPSLHQGVILHRRIDSFTDSHPDLLRARSRFAAPFRRYAGILLDVWFDHRLAIHGEALGVDDPALLQARLDAALQRYGAHLPAPALRFGRAVVRERRLEAYRDPAAVAQALGWLSTRLRHDNPLERGLEALQPLAPSLEEDFLAFWPMLKAHADALKAGWREPD